MALFGCLPAVLLRGINVSHAVEYSNQCLHNTAYPASDGIDLLGVCWELLKKQHHTTPPKKTTQTQQPQTTRHKHTQEKKQHIDVSFLP